MNHFSADAQKAVRRRNLARIAAVAMLLLSGLAAHPGFYASSPASFSAREQKTAPSARFAYGGNAAEVPAEFVENLIFVPVVINRSQPSMFALDSTAAATSVSRVRATEIGLSDLKNVDLGLAGVDMPFSDLPFAERPNFSSEVGRPYQGVLGADFFSRVVVEVDYARQTMRLYDPSAYKYSGKGTTFALQFDGTVPLIGVKFTMPGQKNREEDFVVDTALDASLLVSERFAESHHIFTGHIRTANASNPEIRDGATLALGRLTDFQIGRFQVRNAIATFVPQDTHTGSAHGGVMGGGLLRRFTVVFDYAHRQLILDPNTHFEDYEQEDKSGIALVALGPGLHTFEVIAVQPGTPGAEARVQKGDVIAGIDDEAAADLTLASIRSLFRQTGHKYKLLIQRNGQTVQITVQMRRLL